MILLVTFSSCSLAGLPLLFREGWSMGELRRIARSEERAAEAEFLHETEPAARTPESPSSPRKVSLP